MGLALTGCGGDARSPLDISEGADRPSGRSSSTSAVVGTWQVTLLVAVAGDLQEWTTRWRFGPDRTCAFDRTTLSLVEGVRRTVSRTCSWIDRGTAVEVRYDDTGLTQSLPYEVPAFDRRRLILEGVEYHRIE